ncbi:MAG: oligosaccharide flippase family protein, partial [Pseudomonadota bacterium]
MKLAILQGATLSLVIRVAAAGLILGQSVLLARLMTPEDFGLFNYLVVTTGLLALILQWGMDKSAIRFLPAYVADGNIGAIRTFTAWSFRRMVKLAPVAALAAIALTIAATGTGVTPVVWLCAALVCLALAAVQFLQQIERGFKRIGRSQVFEQIVMPALVLCWAAGFWLLRDAVSVGAIMVGYFASMLLCFLMLGRSVSSNLSRRRRESGSRVASENDDESRWRSVGFSLAIGGLMSYLLIRGEILIVGWFLEG